MTLMMSFTFGIRAWENLSCVHNLQDAIFRNIMEQELNDFDQTSMGMLSSRMSEGGIYVLEMYVERLNNCIQFAVAWQ
jgi:hypothetical protein